MDHQDGENDPLPSTETINLVPIFFRLKGFADPHIIVMIHPNLRYWLDRRPMTIAEIAGAYWQFQSASFGDCYWLCAGRIAL